MRARERSRTRPAFCAVALAGFLTGSLAATVAAAPSGPARARTAAASPRGDPWNARDRMTPAGAVPARPGTRVALAVTSWERLAGDLRTDLRLAWEPARGPGLSVGWTRFWLSGTTGADDLEALAVMRAGDARLALGGGLLRRGPHRVTRWVAAGDARLLGPLVAGARAAVHPDKASWAPEITTVVCVARGPWLGGLELGPRSGDLCVSVGLVARRNLVWTTSWTGDHPRLGLAWGFGAAELRASQAAHPLLGTVQTLAVVSGGLAP